MKEYISKDKVKTILVRILESQLDELPTLTKVYICREFAGKVKQMMKMPEYGFCNIERIMEIALEEMEHE